MYIYIYIYVCLWLHVYGYINPFLLESFQFLAVAVFSSIALCKKLSETPCMKSIFTTPHPLSPPPF